MLGQRAAKRERLIIEKLLEYVSDLDNKIFRLSDAKHLLPEFYASQIEVAFMDLQLDGIIEVNPAHRNCDAPYYRFTEKVYSFEKV